MIKIIAAVGKNLELGYKGTLIWNLPNDLKFFKEQTMGCPVFMGAKTFNSLPKMLPGRKHIVLAFKTDTFNKPTDDVDLVYNLEDAILKCKQVAKDEDLFIIGGASIYKMFVEKADVLILTEIDAEYKNADVYFPSFDKTNYDRKVLGENSDNGIYYKHVVYTKK